MKIEIRCPSCDETYLVDESLLPTHGGDVPCVGCGGTIPVRERPVPGSVEPPPTGTDRTPSREKSKRAETGSAERHDDEVVCPRCKLHFVPRRAHAEAAASAEPGSRPTILVVEDMDYFLEVARGSLGGRFEVRTAKTLAAARGAIDEGGIDLMIIDLTLEGGEQGRALLTSLRPKRFPVLVFTAQDESEMYGEEWEELRRLGADDLVLKGMNVGEVLLRKSAELLGVELGDEDLPA